MKVEQGHDHKGMQVIITFSYDLKSRSVALNSYKKIQSIHTSTPKTADILFVATLFKIDATDAPF